MKLSWQRIAAHTRHAWRLARPGASVSGRAVERIIVSIEHDGLVGLGEAAPTPYYDQSLDTVEQTLAAAAPMLGDRPPAIEEITPQLCAAFDDQRAAVAAIDMALHDWHGQAAGAPLWRSLGLDRQAAPPTSMSIGIDEPAAIAAQVRAAAAFKILKIKVGAERDVQTLATVRAAARDKLVRVDANCGWRAADVDQRVAALEPFDLELIEQPLPAGAFDAVRRLRAQTRIPIIADEDSVRPADVPRLAGVYDGVNIKLSKCGGIYEARRMIALAREHGLKIMLGCMVETSLGVAAAAQLAPLVDYVDLDGHLLLADDPFEGLEVVAGVVRPSERSGLGVQWRDKAPDPSL